MAWAARAMARLVRRRRRRSQCLELLRAHRPGRLRSSRRAAPGRCRTPAAAPPVPPTRLAGAVAAPAAAPAAGAGRPRAALEEAVDGRQQRRRPHRLGHERVHAGSKASLPIAGASRARSRRRSASSHSGRRPGIESPPWLRSRPCPASARPSGRRRSARCRQRHRLAAGGRQPSPCGRAASARARRPPGWWRCPRRPARRGAAAPWPAPPAAPASPSGRRRRRSGDRGQQRRRAAPIARNGLVSWVEMILSASRRCGRGGAPAGRSMIALSAVSARVGDDQPRQPEAVHARHLDVDERQRYRRAAIGRDAERGHRRGAPSRPPSAPCPSSPADRR